MRPEKTEEFEVVVIGAGIAGLLLASELATHHRVLVLEKQPEVRSQKYWLTDSGCIKHSPELIPCIDIKYQHIDFIAHDQTAYRCHGDYILWKTENLLLHLRRTFESRGGKILKGHTFYSYKAGQSEVTIFANDLAISASLAIDCMGYASPIIYAKGVIDILGYYLLYGATFQATRTIDPIGLHNLSISAKPRYIEAFPTNDNRLHLILIMPTGSIAPTSTLREEFSFIINRSPYRNVIHAPQGGSEFLGGIIPVGILRRQALDRIFFFGEAGQSNPAATATALTRMLYTYKSIASLLSAKLASDHLMARDLQGKEFDPISHFDRQLQVALFRDILIWNSDKFREIVQEMIRTDNHDIVNGIMFGDLFAPAYLGLGSIYRLLARRSKNIMLNLAKGLSGLDFT